MHAQVSFHNFFEFISIPTPLLFEYGCHLIDESIFVSQMFEACLRVDPSMFMCLVNLAESHRLGGKYSLARKAAEHALRIAPDSPVALANYILYLQVGKKYACIHMYFTHTLINFWR